jgi:hypothetical protein
MDPVKIFLSVVGLIYIAFSAWCTLKPETTAASLGLRLDPGSGQSEYVTVYGGFQLALAIVFLWPWIDSSVLPYSLLACIVFHGCLVVFRSLGFAMFTGIQPMTIGFAISEWVVFLGALACWWSRRA